MIKNKTRQQDKGRVERNSHSVVPVTSVLLPFTAAVVAIDVER